MAAGNRLRRRLTSSLGSPIASEPEDACLHAASALDLAGGLSLCRARHLPRPRPGPALPTQIPADPMRPSLPGRDAHARRGD